MTTIGKVLLIDDDQALCGMVEEGLSGRGYEVACYTLAHEGIEQLRAGTFDVLVTDLNLKDMTGIDVCRWAAENRPSLPVVVITAFGCMGSAVAALRAGAYDFISKPLELDTLAYSCRRAIQHRDLSERVRFLEQEMAKTVWPDDIVGESLPMRRVGELALRLSQVDATVLITGESGTGKELIARAIHQRSPRANKPFVAINCAAMPAPLLESELFGHVRGAFTDAKTSRDGVFVQASGGTLLLDEVGEMPLEMQTKLLRALQEGRVRPVGAAAEKAFDSRIIAATNRDLEEDVAQGRFREDLFYRLNVVQVELPPLRERGNDVLLLAQCFVRKYGEAQDKPITRLSHAAARRLLDYAWPGNVRELQNCIERAVTLSRVDQITVEDLPERIQDYRSTRLTFGADASEGFLTLDELERRYIERVLKAVGGNKTEAARILGVDRRTLYRRAERWSNRPAREAEQAII